MAERLPGPGLEAGRAAASGGLHGRAAVPGTGYGGLYIPAMHMLRPAVEWAMTMISNMDSDEQRLAEFTEMDVEAVRHMAVEAYTYPIDQVRQKIVEKVEMKRRQKTIE